MLLLKFNMDPGRYQLAHPNIGRVPIKLVFFHFSYLHVIVKVSYEHQPLPISASRCREGSY